MATINPLLRSKETITMVRVDDEGNKITTDLPIGRGWNDGSGVIFWRKLGWETLDKHNEQQHQKEVAAKREAVASKGTK
jgi:hypothetical protein